MLSHTTHPCSCPSLAYVNSSRVPSLHSPSLKPPILRQLRTRPIASRLWPFASWDCSARIVSSTPVFLDCLSCEHLSIKYHERWHAGHLSHMSMKLIRPYLSTSHLSVSLCITTGSPFDLPGSWVRGIFKFIYFIFHCTITESTELGCFAFLRWSAMRHEYLTSSLP